MEQRGIKVKGFLKEHLKMETEVMETRRVKKEREKDMMIAKVKNWKDKKKIMARKKGLDVDIYIKDDMTIKERKEVQRELRRIAREKRRRQDDGKICIDQRWFKWNEQKGGIVEMRQEKKD
ncbi:hypothetical protein K0M31_011082 [Melipona bicolor]|uniref:Uncharacterized protein n=1 Tax=Melipona bicolor TaxID=60889 RepID=A0AA40KHV2_9HYME|nr:hypothetical protein K0M31_011082 [Melipona bicolor]